MDALYALGIDIDTPVSDGRIILTLDQVLEWRGMPTTP